MTSTSRRKFLTKSALAVGAGGLLAFQAGCSGQSASLNGLFVHHVFFWLKNPDNQQEIQTFQKELDTLTGIDLVRFKHIGQPADTRREVIDSSYTFSLLLLFNSAADQDAYQTHPVHLAFIDRCKDLWDRVLVYDSL